MTALLHAYEADPQSGAGNCVCGGAESHRWHPHPFVAAAGYVNRCVCGLARNAMQHR